MTEPEHLTKQLLESFGFVVKPFSQKQDYDPANVIYMQVPFESMRLDFAFLKAQVAIEVNGDYWHGEGKSSLTSAQIKKKLADAKKKASLEKGEWALIQFPASELGRQSFASRFIDSVLESLQI